MIDLQNECHVGNGIMPGLGELHHRYPIFEIFLRIYEKASFNGQ